MNDRRARVRYWPVLRDAALVELRFAALAVSVVLLVGACASAEDADPAPASPGTASELRDTDPAGVLRGYVDAYNSGDIEAVMTFFTEDSVIAGHPFTREARGLAAIRSLSIEDLDAAARIDPYRILDVHVADDTVTWDHIWTNREGDELCVAGHTATIAGGRILKWTWPATDFSCD